METDGADTHSTSIERRPPAALVHPRTTGRYLPLILALLGVAVTLLAAALIQRSIATDLRVEFERFADERTEELDGAIKDTLQDAGYARGFMAARTTADLEGFRDLILPMLSDHSEIRAVLWVDGTGEGRVGPATLVASAESSDPLAAGLDLGSGEAARTIQDALARGDTTLSVPIRLATPSGPITLVAAVLPARTGAGGTGPAEGGPSSGAAVFLIDPATLLEKAVAPSSIAGYEYRLVDLGAPAGGGTIAAVRVEKDGSLAVDDPTAAPRPLASRRETTFAVGDRTWLVVVGALADRDHRVFDQWNGWFSALLTATVGLLATAGLAYHLYLLRRSRDTTRLEAVALATMNSELLASEQRFRATFEQAAVGVRHSDLQGRVLRVNQKLCDFLGYTREELVGRPNSEIHNAEEEDRLMDSLTLMRAGKLDSFTAEQRFIRKDGSLVWAHVTASLVRDPDGSPAYTMGVIEDISARKALEESLVETQTQLLQAQKLEAVGQLAGGIAHDFNNLLQTILGTAGLAQEALNAGVAASVQADLREIRAAAERAAEVTAKLLAFSRRQPLAPRVFLLDRLISDMAGLLERATGGRVELDFRPNPEVGPVMADPSQIGQVILNLTLNARDAMPQGGTIRIETSEVELDEEFVASHPGAQAGTQVVLTVSDDGQGMDQETQNRIFEPFFTTKEQGTGLGLATSYGIVMQSGGNIYVRSEPGRGTTIEIHLPRRDEPVDWPGGLAGDLSAPDLRGHETILVVEDEAAVRSLVVRILVKQGYTVLAASAPDEAIAVLAPADAPKVDLLLTDIVMPGMSGRDLARSLAATHNPPAKTIYMSGYTRDVMVRDGRLDPSVVLLEKPFSAEVLARTVREVLDGG